MKVPKAIKTGDRVAINVPGYGTLFGDVKKARKATLLIDWEDTGVLTRHNTAKERINVIENRPSRHASYRHSVSFKVLFRFVRPSLL